MKTIAERMRWLLKIKGWTEREWARQAGLKEASNVNKLLRRAEERPDRIPGDANTFVELARAAGASLDWLTLGRGAPFVDSLNVPDDPKYPTRPSVIAAGHLMGYPQAAIQAVIAFDAGPTDPGQDYWLHLLLGKRNEIVAGEARQLTK